MASSWAVSTFPEDLTFTYNWTIDDLNKGLERTEDGIDSPTFKIPSLPWSFFLRIRKISFKYWLDPEIRRETEYRCPRELEIDGTATPITSYFDVQLCVANPNKKEEDLKELKLAGTLYLSETGGQTEWIEGNKLTGEIYDWSAPPECGGDKRTGMIKYSKWSKSWCFGTEEVTCFNGSIDPDDHDSVCFDFYTLGDDPGLSLKAVIKVPSKMVSSSGSVKDADAETFSFKSLLSQPDFSDVRLKCGEKVFNCHKVLLANKSAVFERMLKADMEEAKTGVVEVVDVEEETMEKLLEFIYSGKVEDMDNQLEMLLYAADKYEIQGLIHLCNCTLSQKEDVTPKKKEDVTPKNAMGILLLADRHSLCELKKRVVAWILAEKEVYMADKAFTGEMEKHPALLMELLKT